MSDTSQNGSKKRPRGEVREAINWMWDLRREGNSVEVWDDFIVASRMWWEQRRGLRHHHTKNASAGNLCQQNKATSMRYPYENARRCVSLPCCSARVRCQSSETTKQGTRSCHEECWPNEICSEAWLEAFSTCRWKKAMRVSGSSLSCDLWLLVIDEGKQKAHMRGSCMEPAVWGRPWTVWLKLMDNGDESRGVNR